MISREENVNHYDQSATHYIIHNGKYFYLKFSDSKWWVWFSYDQTFGWGLANQSAIKRNLDKLKPLF